MNTFKKFQDKKNIEEPEVQLMFGVWLSLWRKQNTFTHFYLRFTHFPSVSKSRKWCVSVQC